MRYPIAVETGDAKHAYGVVVPDLPGCFSAGDTLDEALTNSQEPNFASPGRASGRWNAVSGTNTD
jgi:HicB_like antitoxin of bacterial toxin-antitoxin system